MLFFTTLSACRSGNVNIDWDRIYSETLNYVIENNLLKTESQVFKNGVRLSKDESPIPYLMIFKQLHEFSRDDVKFIGRSFEDYQLKMLTDAKLKAIDKSLFVFEYREQYNSDFDSEVLRSLSEYNNKAAQYGAYFRGGIRASYPKVFTDGAKSYVLIEFVQVWDSPRYAYIFIEFENGNMLSISEQKFKQYWIH